MGRVSSAGLDAVVLVPTRWALGFAKSVDNRHLPAADREGVLLSEEAFGHSGFGGSIGFADPRARLSRSATGSRTRTAGSGTRPACLP